MTKKETQNIIKQAGGPYFLAARITGRFGAITPQAICQWDQVPAKRAVQLAVVTGLPKSFFRPDLFD